MLPRVKINFGGESELFNSEPVGAVARFKISRPATAPELDLGKISPNFKGVRVKGNFQLDGDLKLNMNGLSVAKLMSPITVSIETLRPGERIKPP